MKYEIGDIGFVYNGAFISKIMRWVMGSKWSHSFLVIGELNGETMVIETSDFEVTIAELSRYLDGRPCEVYRANESVQLVNPMKLNGSIYGYLQLPVLGIRRLFYKLFKIPNFIRQGIICCQVPMYAYQDYFEFDYKSLDTEEFYQVVKNKFKNVYKSLE
jgi:hypothetical protein